MRIYAKLVLQVSHHTTIYITTACTHDEAFQWGETHRGVYHLAILDGCNGSTIAYVASDDFLSLWCSAQHLAYVLAYEAVRGAVEAIAADLVLLIILVWQRIEVCIVGHGLMESSIKHTYLWDVWQNGLHGSYTLEVGRIVQRSEVVASLESLQHFRREEGRLGEFLAAMHHAVSHSIDFIQ